MSKVATGAAEQGAGARRELALDGVDLGRVRHHEHGRPPSRTAGQEALGEHPDLAAARRADDEAEGHLLSVRSGVSPPARTRPPNPHGARTITRRRVQRAPGVRQAPSESCGGGLA